jgi:hypothetical protein
MPDAALRFQGVSVSVSRRLSVSAFQFFTVFGSTAERKRKRKKKE